MIIRRRSEPDLLGGADDSVTCRGASSANQLELKDGDWGGGGAAGLGMNSVNQLMD